MIFKGYSDENLVRQLNGRFAVLYRIAAEEKNALEMAKNICVEQTVEFPAAHIECDAIQEHIIGRLEEFSPCAGGYLARISYSNQCATEEFSQFFNVVFGNSSLIPGITVLHIELSEELLGCFPGRGLHRGFLRVPGRLGRAFGRHRALLRVRQLLPIQPPLGNIQ